MKRVFATASTLFRTRWLMLFGLCMIPPALSVAGLIGNSRRAAPSLSAAAATPAPPPPAVVASTFLGGPGFEITWACAADAAGNVYIAGDAQNGDFPVTADAFQKTYGDGGQDGFVAKLD